jgi:hypothetical protein
MSLRTAVPVLLMMAGALADPDFTGAWKLKQERSESGTIPAPAAVMKIERQKGAFGVAETLPDGARVAWFVGLGKELRTTSGSMVMRSIGKWEADAMLINTIVNGPKGDYAVMDRWVLSRDGATLTIRREVVRRTGGAESILTYEKEK